MGAGGRVRRLAERAEGAPRRPASSSPITSAVSVRLDPDRGGVDAAPGDGAVGGLQGAERPVLRAPTATCSSPTRARPGCTTRPGGSTAWKRPAGSTCLIGTVPSPNGMVVAPDMSHLLVAVTRANQVWRLPLHADGSVTKAGIFCHLHGGPSGRTGWPSTRRAICWWRTPASARSGACRPVPSRLERIASCAGCVHDQSRLRRRGPAEPVHHGIRDGQHTPRGTRARPEPRLLACRVARRRRSRAFLRALLRPWLLLPGLGRNPGGHEQEVPAKPQCCSFRIRTAAVKSIRVIGCGSRGRSASCSSCA